MTLEQYFINEFLRSGVIDHTLRVSINTTTKRAEVSFYIHPSGHDGCTCDFIVRDNEVRPDPKVTPLA